MTYSQLILERSDAVALLTINNPSTLNALDSLTLHELHAAISEIEADSTLRALIITGTGRSFVAGAYISEMRGLNAAEGKAFGHLGASMMRRLELLPIPVIAAINGFALGGGCELAMACDIRLASSKAKLGQPETGLGIIPGFSGTQRLPRLVGPAKAKELIFTGDVIRADEALRIGLVDKVTEPEALMDEAMALADKIASKAPAAIAYAKEAINRGIQTDIDTAIDLETELFALCFATDDQKEGMQAFLEKRKPEFKNH